MESLENPIPTMQQFKHDIGLLYHSHALLRMIQRDITTEQIEQALDNSKVEIIRNYPRAGRPCPEYLILGEDESGRSLHILTAYPMVEVITAYEPVPPKWVNPRERRQ